MALIVQKYGGTSVGTVERIKNVARRVAQAKANGDDVVVVVSAMSGETNRLVALAHEIQEKPSPREMDVVLSTGEQVTIGLLAMALHSIGVDAKSYTGWQVAIKTDCAHTKARIDKIDEIRIRTDLDAGKVVIIAGFQGINANNDITTLGRGGSDTSAVALAAALKADECQIYTDVDGVYTTDPRVVSEARRLSTISFEEMLELASLGSKVLQIRSVEFAGKYKVRLRVLSSLENSGKGTLITFEEDQNMMEHAAVSGIAFDKNQARINVRGVPDTPGIASLILGAVADANIEVDMIIQNFGSAGTTDFSFTVPRSDYQNTLDILHKAQEKIGAHEICGDDTVCKVSIVGMGMRSHVGIASTMFRTLAKENINIQMISTSEIKVSVLIDEKYLELATRVLHQIFELDKEPEKRS
ncbi:aspartate kinase [Snodgrassella communis]|jgi:aspartate kinase|uniref:Aspartokinase n=2 Tax=Snodgrassella TaxID=1193515 RepID=A0A2N9XH90_9NEIS|nr:MULTISPECIES: aspartate kinase [Snodgrassella]KDN15286.1 Aspartokinase [Snodgrassella communis]PIT09318.1 aspartate kinase [Snodgrassella communis]PIT09718.1 aspartate kinase [Snodgrassella communis]PIT22800.1 aspartate kinase [Snodgrassella communis]PIT24038.1 aspartate kinase [Snodgrassella communis]